MLFDLGLDKEVVGITKFCVHPHDWTQTKQLVGGTKNFRFDVIDQLGPDLIIGNKEENYWEGIQKLRLKFPVWMSDIITFNDALDMIKLVAKMTGKEKEGDSLVSNIQSSFNQVTETRRKTCSLFDLAQSVDECGKQDFYSYNAGESELY